MVSKQLGIMSEPCYNLEFDSQNDKNALGIGSLVVFLVEKVRTIFVFSFVLKCFSFFFEE